MTRKLLWGLLLFGYVVLVVHGATGETGPMGWLNALQQQWTGGYSRKLSFLVFSSVAVALGGAVLLPLLRTAPHRPAVVAAPREPMPKWKVGLLVWIVPVALAWVAVLAYYASDWLARVQDATGRYVPVSLLADAFPAPAASGGHLALQGRFDWDHAIDRRERDVGDPETTFVPVVDRGARAGAPVRFLARFDHREVDAWRHAAAGPQDAILARVQGAVPAVEFGVFANAGVTLAPSALLVLAVPAVGGLPAQAGPEFDAQDALLLGTVLTVVWSVSLLAIGLALAKQRWSERRDARRPAGQPRKFEWLGWRYRRK